MNPIKNILCSIHCMNDYSMLKMISYLLYVQFFLSSLLRSSNVEISFFFFGFDNIKNIFNRVIFRTLKPIRGRTIGYIIQLPQKR